jgi:tetratricopeptide (TPR) repeat protein/transcriptional regulator with XRE-family HTH domain
MSTKYGSHQTTILAELRQKAGLTQDQVGGHFGLKGKKRRDSVGNWERGVERPHHKLRPQFISYLWYTLGLLHNARRFYKVWEDVMVGQWQWLPLDRDELPPAEEAPFQAIADIPYFVGREQELDELKTVLSSNNRARVCGLHGMGGVGKTTLAAHAAYWLHPYFPDGVLWVRLDLSETLSVLSTFAGAYGHDVSQYPDLDSRSRVVRGILAYKRALMVLDNAQNNEQIEALLPPATGGCAVIVTTRQRNLPALLGAHWLHVRPFQKETGETLQLFTRILGQARAAGERKPLAEIADLLGHLPLAVAIVAGRLLADPAQPAAALLPRLRREKERLGELEYGDWSARTSFNVSYGRLAPALQRFFVALGVFAGQDFGLDAVAYVAGTSLEATQNNLEKLGELSLVQRGRPGRYRLHPLLHDYARERITHHDPFRRMAEHYEQVLNEARGLYERGGEKLKQGLALFDLERGNIQAGQAWAAAHAPEDGDALSLCCDYPLSGDFLLHLRLHPREVIQWCESALAAADRLNRRAAEGRQLVHLGLACHYLGQLQVSVSYFERARAIFRDLGDRRNECNALDKLGLVYTRLGEFKQAIELHEQALRLARETGDRQPEANALGNLGVAHKNAGNLRQALECQEQTLAIARERGDLQGIGASLTDLATVYLELNERSQAIELYEQALPVVRQVGDEQIESIILSNLGWAYAGLKESGRAIEFYERALAIDRKTGNRYGEGITLNSLGEAYLALRQPRRAIALHKQALSIAAEVGDRVGEGDALGSLGQAYQNLGQVVRAIEFYRQALNQYEESDYLSGQVVQLHNLGSACRELGRADEAQAYFHRHEVICDRLKRAETASAAA